MSRVKVVVRYKPANHQRDLPRGSHHLAMDAFLLSDEVQDVSMAAARDMARDMAIQAVAEGAADTGAYASGFEVEERQPLLAGGNLRRAAVVRNSTDAAAPMEFGNRRVGEGRRIMLRVGLRYHTPRGIA